MSPLPDEASLTDDVELLGSELQLDSLDLATIFAHDVVRAVRRRLVDDDQASDAGSALCLVPDGRDDQMRLNRAVDVDVGAGSRFSLRGLRQQLPDGIEARDKGSASVTSSGRGAACSCSSP